MYATSHTRAPPGGAQETRWKDGKNVSYNYVSQLELLDYGKNNEQAYLKQLLVNLLAFIQLLFKKKLQTESSPFLNACLRLVVLGKSDVRDERFSYLLRLSCEIPKVFIQNHPSELLIPPFIISFN